MIRRNKKVWIICFALGLISLLASPSLTAFAKHVIESKTVFSQQNEKSHFVNVQESVRSSLQEGVEALNQGDPLMAGVLLEGLEVDYPVLGDYILYYRIRALLDSGETTHALTLADNFFSLYPESTLIDLVQVERVKVFLKLEQFQEARALAQSLLQKDGDPERTRQVTLMLGASYEGEEDGKNAFDLYQRLAYEEPVTPEGEEAEQRMKLLAETPGLSPDKPTDKLFLAHVAAFSQALLYDRVIQACDAFQKAYAKSPYLDKALLLKAKALMKRGKTNQGEKIYQQLARSASAGKVQAEAAYRLGSYYWNQHQNTHAKKEFNQLNRRYPKSFWSLKARYALGRIYESEVSLTLAKESYLSIGKINSRDELAPEGAWRAGWVEYKAVRYEQAKKAFDFCMRRYPDSDFYADALYWKGRCEEKLTNHSEAQKIFQRLVDDYTWDFYGIMAAKRVKEHGEENLSSKKDSPKKNSSNPGRLMSQSSVTFHLRRAEELIRIGFYHEAEREVDALRKHANKDAELTCTIGELYEQSRNYYDSVRWMYRADREACRSNNIEETERYLYPLAFWETVYNAAEKVGIDPFLILSVMRQESLYQPKIVSLADARGLMQIIPPTGQTIAQRLGVQDFSPETLFEPQTNIAFGAWYLGSLMKRSEGDLVRALSSYNAGETSSDRWWKLYKHLELDERIESITYRETKGYVKKVMRNLENYKRLYKRSALYSVDDTIKD